MPISLSQRVEELSHECEGRAKLTLKEVMDLIGYEVHALIALLLSLPFILLLPSAALAILFGASIFVNGISVARNKPLWIPKKLQNKQISGDNIAKNLRKTKHFLKWIEKFIRPRGTVYQENETTQLINGCFLAMGGFFLFLPFSPGSNFLPSLAILFLALGILESDLLMLCIGYFLTILSFVLYIIVPLVLME